MAMRDTGAGLRYDVIKTYAPSGPMRQYRLAASTLCRPHRQAAGAGGHSPFPQTAHHSPSRKGHKLSPASVRPDMGLPWSGVPGRTIQEICTADVRITVS